jgi:hypothetical protein
MIDLMAGEYGWQQEGIISMPIDQPPQLIHAMLVRRGVKVFRSKPIKDESAPSLSDRIKQIFQPIDTTQELWPD